MNVSQLAYIKNGCFHHEDCFTCPFKDCIIDTAKAYKTDRGVRNREILRLSQKGWRFNQLAIHFHLHERTIGKIVRTMV